MAGSGACLGDILTRPLGHLVDGRSRKQIAAIETVSINTVKTQIRTAFHKLGARSAHEAQVRAIELGLI